MRLLGWNECFECPGKDCKLCTGASGFTMTFRSTDPVEFELRRSQFVRYGLTDVRVEA